MTKKAAPFPKGTILFSTKLNKVIGPFAHLKVTYGKTFVYVTVDGCFEGFLADSSIRAATPAEIKENENGN